jgi:hypothetical protein
MLFARIENNQIVEYPVDIFNAYPNISFSVPISVQALPEGIVVVKEQNRTAHNKYSHRLIESTPIFENNEWIQNWVLEELSEEEKSQKDIGYRSSIIVERNYRLLNSDWTELPSVQKMKSEEWKSAWEIYRQALRDVPEQTGFPYNVIWPEEPSINS